MWPAGVVEAEVRAQPSLSLTAALVRPEVHPLGDAADAAESYGGHIIDGEDRDESNRTGDACAARPGGKCRSSTPPELASM